MLTRWGTVRSLGLRQGACAFFFSVLAGAGLAPVHAADSPEVSRGLAWLQAQVQADGSLAGEPGSIAIASQAGAEALTTLAQLAAAPSPLAQRVAADTNTGTETLARSAIALVRAGETSTGFIVGLRARQNPDGGFGDLAGSPSNTLDTAWTLLAFRVAGFADAPSLQSALNYLIASAKTDGGFATPGSDSSVYATTYALQALVAYRDAYALSPYISKASSWLNTARGSSFSFGETLYDALATIALASATTDSTQYANLVAALKAAQAEDGSWQQDPYLTALVLRALAGKAQPPPSATQGRVMGHIVDASTRAPIGDAGINVAGLNVNSDANGYFETAGVNPGSYPLTVAKAGYASAQVQVTVSTGATTDAGDIALAVVPDSALIRGVVIDGGNNQPLAGASILVSVGTRSLSVVSASNGAFELGGIPVGSGAITVQKTGYRSASTALQFAGSTSYNFSPTLYAEGEPAPTTATLSGRIVASDTGTAIAGAQLSVGSKSTVSAADGSFSLGSLDPGATQFTVQASGYSTATFSGVLSAGLNRVGDLRLQPSATQGRVRGQVIDSATHAPLSGASISLAGLSLSSDANGRFETGGIAPGSYALNVAKAGYASAQAQLTVVAGAIIDTGSIGLAVLSDSAVVRGIIIDGGTGQPLAGAAITISAGSSTLSALSAANGAFEVGGIPAASGNISVQKTGYRSVSAAVQFTAGASYNFSPTLYAEDEPAPTQATISGRIIASDTGNAIAGAQIAVGGKAAVSAADGSFSIAQLEPGAATIAVQASGYDAASFSGVLSAGTNRLGDLHLQLSATTLTLYGGVTDAAAGTPVAGALVRVQDTDFQAVTNARGSYRIEGLPETHVNVVVEASGYYGRSFAINASGFGELKADLPLTRAEDKGIRLSAATNLPSYDPFSDVQITATVANEQSQDRKLVLTATVYDHERRVVQAIPFKMLVLSPGIADVTHTIPAGTTQDFGTKWYNQNVSAGDYTIVVSAADESAELLAEASAGVTVNPKIGIGGGITVNPPITQAGTAEPVSISALVGNRGNLDYPGGLARLSIVLDVADTSIPPTTPAAVDQILLGTPLKAPRGSAIDAAGNVYTVNQGSLEVLKIAPSGSAQVLATLPGNSGAAKDLVLLSDGSLRVLGLNGSIYTVNATGLASGSIPTGLSGGGANSITADSAGNLFVTGKTFSDEVLIRIGADGQRTELLRNGLSAPMAVTTGADGRFYVTNFNDNSIARVDAAGHIEAFVTAGLNRPVGILREPAGSFLVADSGSNRILRVGTDRTVSVFASGISAPQYMAYVPSGDLLVSSAASRNVFRVSAAGQVAPFSQSIGMFPAALTYDAAGQLYISGSDGALRRLNHEGTVENLLASGKLGNSIVELRFGADGGLYALSGSKMTRYELGSGAVTTYASGLGGAVGLAQDSTGNFLVAETTGNRIARITGAGVGETVAQSLLATPQAVTSKADGTRYILNYSSLSWIPANGRAGVLVPGLGGLGTDIALNPAGGVYALVGGTKLMAISDAGVMTLRATVPYSRKLAVTADDTVYLLDQSTPKIYRLNPDNTLQTFVTTTAFMDDIDVDPAGGLVAAGNDGFLYRIASNGSVVKGTSSGRAFALSVAADGSIYALLQAGQFVRINAAGQKTTLLSGLTARHFARLENGTFDLLDSSASLLRQYDANNALYRTTAGFSSLTDVEWMDGEVVFSDSSFGRVYKLSPDDGVARLLASVRVSQLRYDGGVLYGTVNGGGRVVRIDADGRVTDHYVNNTLTSLRGIAVRTGEIAIANEGSHRVLIVSPDRSVKAAYNGYNTTTAIAVDSGGGIYVAHNAAVVRYSADGLQSDILVSGGRSALVFAPDGTLWAGTGTVLSRYANGQFVNIANTSTSITSLAFDGSQLYATDAATLRRLSGSTLPVFAAGISDVRALRFGPDNALYMAGGSSGKIMRYGANGVQLVADGLSEPQSLNFRSDGLYVGGGSNLYRVDTLTGAVVDQGLGRLLTNSGLRGLESNSQGQIIAVAGNRSALYRIEMPHPVTLPPPGTEVYSAATTLAPIAVGGTPQSIDLGTWVPPYAGDYSVHLVPGDGVSTGDLINSLHVGPHATGTMTADRSSVSPGDAQLRINIGVTGADFSTLSKADASNVRHLFAATRPSVMGVDPSGNIYFADSLKIVRIKPDGASETFYSTSATGSLTPVRGMLPIDRQASVYTANYSRQLLRIRQDGSTQVVATLPDTVNHMVIDSSDNLIVVLVNGHIYKVRQDGSSTRLNSAAGNGVYALAIDGLDNLYLFDGTNSITKLSSSSGSATVVLNGSPGLFEYEGMPVAGDCSDNLLVVPIRWPEIGQTYWEETSLVQISGKTGKPAKLFDGFSVSPRIDDMDFIVYDRFGQSLLMWTDNGNRISRMPISCGAISTDLHVVTPAGQTVSGFNAAPSMVVANPDGSQEQVWTLKDVTDLGRNVQFDTILPGMRLGEERAVATEAYLLFRNSFTGGQIKLPLDIPKVNTGGLVAMSLSIDQTSYPANTEVVSDLVLHNPNNLVVQGRLRVDLLDASGALVKTVLDEDQTVDASSQLVLHPPLNTGSYYAGGYSLKASFTDGSGYLQANASAQFSITASGSDPSGQASVKVTPTTDKPVYGEFDAVQIQGRARSQAANYIYEDLTLILTVVDPNGAQVFSESRAIRQLMPGAMVDVRNAYKLPGGLTGIFGVHAAILDRSGSVIAAGTTSFEARADDAAKLTGSVVAARKIVPLSESQTCRDTVTNGGERSLMGLPVRQSIIELASDRLVTTTTREYDLPAHGQETLTRVFSTDGYALAPHACVLEAQVAGKWKTLGYDTFTVDPPPIRVTAAVNHGKKGRLLVLMDGAPVTGSSKTEPAPEQQRGFLEKLLTREGWSYTIVTDPEAFTWELRSGAYNVYALFSESAKLDERVQMELREAVYRGEGLLEAGAHDQRHQNFDDALGIKYQGKASGVTGIEVQATEPGPAGYADLALRDKPLRATLGAASSLGRYTGGKSSDPSAVGTRGYGRGKSVYLGYDLLAEAALAGDTSLHAQLLIRSLGYVQPAYAQTLAGRVIPITITLQNEGNATPGELVLPMPSGASIVDRGSATVRDGALVWSYELEVDEEESFTAWVRLPSTGGRVSFTAQILTGPPANRVPHDTATLTLEPIASGGLSDARQLAGSIGDFKQVRLWLDKADAALQSNDADTALSHLAKASDELLKVSHASAGELRLLIDQALLDAGRRYWGG